MRQQVFLAQQETLRAEMGVSPFVHVKVVFIKLMRLKVTYFKNSHCSYILETSQTY